MLKFELSHPKLAINKYLQVVFYVTFPRMNYDSKKGLAWDLPDIHVHIGISLHFEAICHYPFFQNNLLSPDI
jgi:hypothetical protein